MIGLGLLLSFVFDPTILTFVAIGGIGYALISWFMADRMVAGITGAQKIEKRDNPYLYRLLENVSIAAGLRATPELRLVQDDAPNAFAAGRSPKKAFVAATTGLVELMDERELEGVLVSHIRNRDVELMTLASVARGRHRAARGHPAPHGVLRRQARLEPDHHDRRLRRAAAGPGRGHRHPARSVAAARVPGRRFRSRDHERRRRHGARAAQAAARRTRSATRAARRLTCTSKPAASGEWRGASFSGLFSTHPPLEKRIEALEGAGGFRLAPSQRRATRTSSKYSPPAGRCGG